MRLFILSDLHITAPEHPHYEALLRWIREHRGSDSVFVFAGDVFDLFWGGNSYFLERYHSFFAEIEGAAELGATFHFLEGNHDFLFRAALDRYFARKALGGAVPARILVHDESCELTLAEKRFYIAHGDLVDREDRAYLFLRRLLRTAVSRWVFGLTPGKAVVSFGDFVSRLSRHSRADLSEASAQAARARIRQIYRDFALERAREGADFVVLGHCHDSHEFGFELNGRRAVYCNMGFPQREGTYLEWNSQDQKLVHKPWFSVLANETG